MVAARFATLCYMSPAPCLNQPVDGRSNLYSLSVVFYEMLRHMFEFSFKARLTYRQAADFLLLVVWLVVACTGLVTEALRFF